MARPGKLHMPLGPSSDGTGTRVGTGIAGTRGGSADHLCNLAASGSRDCSWYPVKLSRSGGHSGLIAMDRRAVSRMAAARHDGAASVQRSNCRSEAASSEATLLWSWTGSKHLREEERLKGSGRRIGACRMHWS